MKLLQRFLLTSFFTSVFFQAIGFAEDKSPPKNPALPITIKSELDHAFMTIGDPVQYTVTLKYDADVQILSSIEAPPGDVLKIKTIEEFQRKEGKKKVSGRKFTLTSFRLGESVIDPVKIQYRVGEGSVQTLTSNPLYLTVKSVAEGEVKNDIRGIKSVLPLLQSLWPWILTIIILSAGISGFIAYRISKNKKLTPSEGKPKLSPEDEALLELSRLYDGDLLRRGKIKEYHLRLSEVLRIYFEKRFQILAIELTTYEISRALKNKAVDPKLREKIIEILEYADLVKFAKWLPGPAKVAEMYQKSRQIVEEARPKLQEIPHAV